MKWLGRILLFSALPIPLLAQDIYIWQDSYGIIHFADAPKYSNAKKVTLPDLSVKTPEPKYQVPKPMVHSSGLKHEEIEPQPNKLPKIKVHILSPADNSTIRNNTGNITIQGQLSRSLTNGESLQLMMNGSPYGAPTKQPVWQLKNRDRGTHTISIQILKGGKLIASSISATIHLHRASKK
ncbi:Ig-like domain-containing protein [Vibrio maerlii]|uniref:Ig-like domain-containing protein n=1 Tax=Vibrio maerlii TaxID=2231648 RepID=UPI000E3E2D28|nr:Ig-like domain-containing protein [Vibrio maerlii]